MSDRYNPRAGVTYARASKAVRALGGDPAKVRRQLGKRHTYNVSAVVRKVANK